MTPQGFTGGDPEPVDVWVSVEVLGDQIAGTEWRGGDRWWLSVIGRVTPGVNATRIKEEASLALRSAPTKLTRQDPRPEILMASLLPGSSPIEPITSRAANEVPGQPMPAATSARKRRRTARAPRHGTQWRISNSESTWCRLDRPDLERACGGPRHRRGGVDNLGACRAWLRVTAGSTTCRINGCGRSWG